MNSEIKKPSKKHPVGDLIFYYLEIKEMKQTVLAARARMTPQKINAIVKNNRKSPSIKDLIKISLALQLSIEETKEILERAGRALNPSNPEHNFYKKLIKSYAKNDFNEYDDDFFLDKADDALSQNGFYKF